MEFTTKNVPFVGGCLQGYVSISYDNLVLLFGEPNSDSDGYKTDAEWRIKFKNGVIATIYNYKSGENYLGDEGLNVEDITDWHIGGNTNEAYQLVNELIQTNNFNEIKYKTLISKLDNLIEDIIGLIDTMPNKGDKSTNSQKIYLLNKIKDFAAASNGIEPEDLIPLETINGFFDKYCTKISEDEDLATTELYMDNHYCLKYNDNFYYLPETISIMPNDDQYLYNLILNKYQY